MEMFIRGVWDPLHFAGNKMIILVLIPTTPQTSTPGRVMETSGLYFANLRFCCYNLLIICKTHFCYKSIQMISNESTQN